MKVGKYVYTPRFCTVKIERVFGTAEEAGEHGFTEPTYYHRDGWTVLGHCYRPNHMEFAAVREER